jgi:hypothetical protein
VEDLGRRVLRFVASGNAACHKCVDPIKIRLVQFRKTARVASRGLDQLPLAGIVLARFQVRLRAVALAI